MTNVTMFGFQARELAGKSMISWNHVEFRVDYNSLSEEIRIGDYFLRLLLEEDQMGADHDSVISDSSVFFNDLYHRFLLTPKVEMKCLCLQAMAIVYGRHWEDIGPFHDTRYILAMLDRSVDRQERDRLVLFISKLILHKENVVDVLKASGLKTLVELITLAHLHTSRAVIPTQTQAIEGWRMLHQVLTPMTFIIISNIIIFARSLSSSGPWWPGARQ